MLALLAGFQERDIFGAFKVAAATNAGLAMKIDSSVTAPLTTTPYGNSFGSIIPASPAQTITQAGTAPYAVTAISNDRELGWLLQPVSTSGPSLLNILAEVYDESVAAGGTAALAFSRAGSMIATDQLDSSIVFNGSVALGDVCGINAGKPRVIQAGDAPRLKFMGKVVQRGTITLGSFQIL